MLGHRKHKDGASRRISRAVMAALMVVWSCALPTAAPGQTSNEYQVKAAFLLNFAKFVEWPSDAVDGQLVLGILGDDPFGVLVDQIVSGKLANGYRLTVRRFKWGENLRNCNMLFVSSSERKHLPQIMEALRGSDVLTVGETSQFNHAGGIIRFFIQSKTVRFEINPEASSKTRLKISSKLMALSRAGG